MASFKRISFMVGGVAAALVAFPAQADEGTAQTSSMADSTKTVALDVEAETATVDSTFETVNLEMTDVLSLNTEDTVVFEETSESVEMTTQTLDEYLAESAVVEDTTASLDKEIDASVATSADSFFSNLEAADNSETVAQSEVAQVTRPLYRGVSPFYLGVGGNIGIIDSGKSAVGDFGLNIFSKFSFGPRFSVRPMAQISEDEFNVALPVTYNFNPIDVKGFSIYPSLGGGIDFGSDIGLLINGGIDIPISREFTLNSQLNWRVTEDTGLGLSIGVGYNFPLFFE